jgi:pyruvate/2-oxoglutarate/acetoin dehydrogenase E1 component/TPP-dependent pyruvate/acetoin dehydrogenase alpha subunit
MLEEQTIPNHISLPIDEILKDYRLAYQSRQTSIIGRREVFSGRAKFGIFGDGKELANLAIARAFRKGDWRSGYYRDQTWMFALGVMSIQEFFAQMYAHADLNAEPHTGGRSMNAHFVSRYINPDGSWRDQTQMYNVAADLSPTAAQMPRAVGLAYASVLYRNLPSLREFTRFSHNGDEVTFASIGNASTAEGMFWESVNAIGVLKAPVVIVVYDDGVGISVPNEFQIVKENIYEIMQGFRRTPECNGYDLHQVRGWDYPALVETLSTVTETARTQHIPALVHVIEVTQPQGHSSASSHERYKSPERLEWEKEFDCLRRMRAWMIEGRLISDPELVALEKEDAATVEGFRKRAWQADIAPIVEERNQIVEMLNEITNSSSHASELDQITEGLAAIPAPRRRDVHSAVHEALRILRDEENPSKGKLIQWKIQENKVNRTRYGSHVYEDSAITVEEIKPVYSDSSPTVMGSEVLNACFDAALRREPRLIVFGEDVGKLGDVYQSLKGMQEKYGALRVTDTGIREATILGQAMGMAMRGLRPICEMQYVTFLFYALQLISDDLANLHWRTVGGQKAPVIIRTRGHRFEGIWHSGSPMAGIIHLVRGVNVLVPRDMTRAAGFYNTLLKSEEPVILVEPLIRYRAKERLPDNIAEMTVPLGVPEMIREGSDVTLVTYGSCCRVALEAANRLAEVGIEVEVIDVQSLLPFDIHGMIVASLKKTNRIVFVDEDVPGGTTAYMLQEVIEKQGGFVHLDSPPKTLSAEEHRPAYGSDGDYWSMPNVESIFDAVYEMMNEVEPEKHPKIY